MSEIINKCGLCGSETIFDDDFKLYFCTKCVYAESNPVKKIVK